MSCCHWDNSAPLSVDRSYGIAQHRAYWAAGALCLCAGWHMASEQALGGGAIAGGLLCTAASGAVAEHAHGTALGWALHPGMATWPRVYFLLASQAAWCQE